MLCSTYAILSSSVICVCWLYNLNLSLSYKLITTTLSLIILLGTFTSPFKSLFIMSEIYPLSTTLTPSISILYIITHNPLTLKAHSFSIWLKLVIPSFTKYTSGNLLRQSREVYNMQASASTPQRNTLHGVFGSAESKVSS